jgi:hypothetical protein
MSRTRKIILYLAFNLGIVWALYQLGILSLMWWMITHPPGTHLPGRL